MRRSAERSTELVSGPQPWLQMNFLKF